PMAIIMFCRLRRLPPAASTEQLAPKVEGSQQEAYDGEDDQVGARHPNRHHTEEQREADQCNQREKPVGHAGTSSLSRRTNQRAVRNSRASCPGAPTSCTPSGRPLGPASSGRLSAGSPR